MSYCFRTNHQERMLVSFNRDPIYSLVCFSMCSRYQSSSLDRKWNIGDWCVFKSFNLPSHFFILFKIVTCTKCPHFFIREIEKCSSSLAAVIKFIGFKFFTKYIIIHFSLLPIIYVINYQLFEHRYIRQPRVIFEFKHKIDCIFVILSLRQLARKFLKIDGNLIRAKPKVWSMDKIVVEFELATIYMYRVDRITFR